MAAQHVSLQVHAFIWFDRRDHVWRGLARELSLFAEGETASQVENALRRRIDDYVADAIANDLVSEMIPRPVPRFEWLKLMAYGEWLRLVALVSNLFRRRHDGVRPVQRRMIPC